MDFGLISGLASSLKATFDLGTAAMGVRDAVQLAATVAEMNKKLLDAQQSLFVVGQQAFALQQDLAAAEEKARKLQAAIDERARYALVELSGRQFAYQLKVADVSDGGVPGNREPVHYVCQPCMDAGTKSVLQMVGGGSWAACWRCNVCKAEIAATDSSA